MKPVYIDITDDLSNFIRLCRMVSASDSPQPVFFANGNIEGGDHFLLITALYRVHFSVFVSGHSNKEVIRRIEEEGGLNVIKATVHNWEKKKVSFVIADIPF